MEVTSSMQNTADYDYELPKELIAQQPVARRSDARLMVVHRETTTFQHAYVRDLPELLRRGDALVINDSRVVLAQLIGRRERTGGRWRGLFLREDDPGFWQVLCKARGRLSPGETIVLQDRQARDTVKLGLIGKRDDGVWVVRPQTTLATWDLLDCVGRVPLPHYIRGGNMVDADLQEYQTVNADKPGSIAAPTAGLHFTSRLIEQLKALGIEIWRVTLHVGVGTFRPISTDQIDQHRMHPEWGQIEPATAEALNRVRDQGGRIIAVGTTTVRVLESCVHDHRLNPWSGETTLFIRPSFGFQAVDGLLTNFHLPRSTLLVLVRTFGGDALIREAYAAAIRERYRFFSYGDAMLIL
jgi:S-adenosylmethionine:tRNA ribosyltransferase-isomerase